MNIVTVQDLQAFKIELLSEISKLFPSDVSDSLPMMRTGEVKKLLQCSDSKLETLRKSGMLPFTKVMGTLYYKRKDVERLFNN